MYIKFESYDLWQTADSNGGREMPRNIQGFFFKQNFKKHFVSCREKLSVSSRIFLKARREPRLKATPICFWAREALSSRPVLGLSKLE